MLGQQGTQQKQKHSTCLRQNPLVVSDCTLSGVCRPLDIVQIGWRDHMKSPCTSSAETHYTDGLVQDYNNSSVLAMELLKSFSKPSMRCQYYSFLKLLKSILRIGIKETKRTILSIFFTPQIRSLFVPSADRERKQYLQASCFLVAFRNYSIVIAISKLDVPICTAFVCVGDCVMPVDGS